MNNKEIDILLHLVEQKFDHGPIKTWKNGDFESLRFVIHRKTKTLISVATLKRIFGKVKVEEGYKPQTGTLDALKLYVNYAEALSNYEEHSRKSRQKTIRIIFAVLLIAVVGMAIARLITESEPHKAILQVEKIEGKCPSTVEFNVSVPNNNLTTHLIRGQGLSPIEINKDKDVRIFYPLPGLFRAYLQQKEQKLTDPVDVLVQTDGWQAFTYYFEKANTRYYPVPMEKAIVDSSFHLATSIIGGVGIDTTQIVCTRLDNYKTTDFSADNFSYKAQLKNSKFWPGVRCFSSLVTIQGSTGKIKFQLSSEGCSLYSGLSYGEKVVEDKEQLSNLALDIKNWQNLVLINDNKKVSMEINGKNVFQGEYAKSLGKLVGTTIEFHGSGNIRSVDLTSKGKSVLHFPDN